MVWVVGDATISGSESGTSFRQALFFKDVCGFNLHDTMIWEKPHFGNPSSTRCHQIFEYMFGFSKGKPATFHQLKDVPIKFGKPVGKSSRRHRDGTITNDCNTRQSDSAFGGRKNIWKLNTSGQEQFGKKQEHPATFSEALARDHIMSWSNPGDLVLDPFLGSGTTGKMALQLGRKFVGIEISNEYMRIARAASKLPTITRRPLPTTINHRDPVLIPVRRMRPSRVSCPWPSCAVLPQPRQVQTFFVRRY